MLTQRRTITGWKKNENTLLSSSENWICDNNKPCYINKYNFKIRGNSYDCGICGNCGDGYCFGYICNCFVYIFCIGFVLIISILYCYFTIITLNYDLYNGYSIISLKLTLNSLL